MDTKWIRNLVPYLLTVVSLVGVGATAYFAAKEAPKAAEEMEREQRIKGQTPLSKTEQAKVIVKTHPKTAASIAVTGAGVIGMHILCLQNARAYSALAAYLVTFSQAVDDASTDLFGERGHHALCSAVQNRIHDEEVGNPPWDELQTFYYEPLGKFFESTMCEVTRAEYHINRNLAIKSEVTLNEFLGFLHQEPVKKGELYGWDLYDGEAFYGYTWIDFEHNYITDEEGNVVCEIKTPFDCHPLGQCLEDIYDPIEQAKEEFKHDL